MSVPATPPSVVYPAPRQVRGLANQTAAWLRANGYSVPGAQVYVSPAKGDLAGRAEMYGIVLSPVGLRNLKPTATLAYRGRPVADWQSPGYEGARVLIHELLHGKRQSQINAGDVPLEEAAVESATYDLLPAWWKRFMRAPIGPMDVNVSPYSVRVAWLRNASAKATGKPWSSYAARVWRRDLLRASDRRAILPDLTGLY